MRMHTGKFTPKIALVLGVTTLLTGCFDLKPDSNVKTPGQSVTASEADPPTLPPTESGIERQIERDKNDAVQVVAKPEVITVLVNKMNRLPSNYIPSDLVEPNIPFIFTEKDEKRFMRNEAAQALDKLFAAAEKDGISLAGVSAYRSYETQKSLFNHYVKVQGEEKARKNSAKPGHSEHQTGLAIDISDSRGKCAAEDCFADTPEAKWLIKHAHEYGFIIRYPKGKEAVTGYNFEPWHIRYVGTNISMEVAKKGLTLEEYIEKAVLASK
ncbi:M15 family metallopeptidase [Effusibacillus consociatus]|uniref:D-alanyl-D-alanine carboxypeptidase family protein n=1 Tax=Effusibacillus consociatus TaxID=1117041 RepID=A0ABV9Q6J7_9BACL